VKDRVSPDAITVAGFEYHRFLRVEVSTDTLGDYLNNRVVFKTAANLDGRQVPASGRNATETIDEH
jgi:hypothetical protein